MNDLTINHFIAIEPEAKALDSYLEFMNAKFEEMKNNRPSIGNKALSQANDALSGLNYIRSGVDDALSEPNYIRSGVDDALSGLNYIRSGLNDDKENFYQAYSLPNK